MIAHGPQLCLAPDNSLSMAGGMFRTRSEQVMRTFVRRRFKFVRLEEMVRMSADWARQIQGSFDVILAMPRSGLIVGNIMAAHMDLPLSTPDLFVKGELLMSEGDPSAMRNILLVDDSIGTGKQMRETLEMLHATFPDRNITSAALLPHQHNARKVDLYYKIIPAPRLFEWDIAHTKKVRTVGFDMDGVLCEDVPESEEGDEVKYTEWISNCRPFLIPRYEIDFIISNRLEKYRQPTEDWLRRHGVRYRHLLLWDLPNKGDRGTRFAANKIRQVLRTRPKLFVESSFWQARKVWAATGVPTLCTDTMTLLN